MFVYFLYLNYNVIDIYYFQLTFNNEGQLINNFDWRVIWLNKISLILKKRYFINIYWEILLSNNIYFFH